MKRPAKMLPALPVREPDAADHAFDEINAFLQGHLSGDLIGRDVEPARLAYQAAQLLRQYARHGIPPRCECKRCRDDRAAAKKGKRNA